MAGFHFRRLSLRPWTGRYKRIPGETTALHVKRIGKESRVVIVWDADGYRRDCDLVDGPGARSLAAAVVAAKEAMGGDLGGSFQVNEFGQVLVPSTDGEGQRLLAGQVRGSLRFQDPLQGGTFTLGDDSDLSAGDRWPLPYVGIPYNLSARNEVYFWREDQLRGEKEKPPRLDSKLVPALRSVRRGGAIRFVVNSESVVLTKRRTIGPQGDAADGWEPTYIGRVDLGAWFEKEE